MEQDNKRLRAMLEALGQENEALRGQLAQPGAASIDNVTSRPTQRASTHNSQESAVLIYIAIMLLFCVSTVDSSTLSTLPLLLGSAAAAPLLLALVSELLRSTRGSRRSSAPRAAAALRALLGIKALLAAGSASLARRRHDGRSVPRDRGSSGLGYVKMELVEERHFARYLLP